MKHRPLTVEELGKILHDAFAVDEWGSVDTSCFNEPPHAGTGTEYDGLYEVLERAVAEINRRLRGD